MKIQLMKHDFGLAGCWVRTIACGLAVAICCSVSNAAITTYNLDFDTEDDFTTPLVNGQSISTFPDVQDAKDNNDTVFEFGRLVNISTLAFGSDGHEGAAIFDSTPGGPNDDGGILPNGVDRDLLVDKGNIMILQNDSHPATTTDPTYGLVFDVPNDESNHADRGAIVFDFTMPVEPVSIDLIDIDDGCRYVTVMLMDENQNMRIYDVPGGWTYDVTQHTKGWHTLDLTSLLDQPGEPGTFTWSMAWQDFGFDPLRVNQLKVTLDGSAGIDNVVFRKRTPTTDIPEPSSVMLLAIGAVALLTRRRRPGAAA
jgi:hypothetical protein